MLAGDGGGGGWQCPFQGVKVEYWWGPGETGSGGDWVRACELRPDTEPGRGGVAARESGRAG